MFRKFLSKDLLVGAIPMACGIALSSLWLAAQQPAGQGNADLILHNGKILTVDNNFSIAEAVAITGNKIAAVGTNQQVLQQAGSNTLKIDLKGRTVVPGLMDTHINSWVSPGGYRAELSPDNVWDFIVDWKGVAKKEDVLNQMRGFMDEHKPPAGGWLRFQNSPQGQAQVRLILAGMNRYDLDTVTPNNPVLLNLGFPDENGVFVNSKAIDNLWKNDGDFLRKYGRYWVGRDGQPDGHLESPATTLVLAKYMPRATAEEMARARGPAPI